MEIFGYWTQKLRTPFYCCKKRVRKRTKMKTNYKLPGLPGLPTGPTSTAKTTLTRNAGLSKATGFSKSAPQSVNFGRASRAATKSPKTTSSFSQIFSASTPSGGLGGTISQAVGFGGGIGSLISGLTSLFGGGKTAPPALTAYQLPTSQTQSISTGSIVSTPGIYGGPSAPPSFEIQSGQIVQSIKQALLNSSSLNDVIAEL